MLAPLPATVTRVSLSFQPGVPFCQARFRRPGGWNLAGFNKRQRSSTNENSREKLAGGKGRGCGEKVSRWLAARDNLSRRPRSLKCHVHDARK